MEGRVWNCQKGLWFMVYGAKEQMAGAGEDRAIDVNSSTDG